MPDKAAEIRIHGIGNHEPLSALGSPVDVQGRRIRGSHTSEFVTEGLKTNRETWFIAWTRTARSLNSVVWYLAVPFTLANTAGHMKPLGKGAGFHEGLVKVFGLLLTLGAYFWSVNLVETFTFRVFNRSWPTEFGPMLLTTIVWVGGLGWRLWRKPRRAEGRDEEQEIDCSTGLFSVHLLLIVAAATAITVCKPGRATTSPDADCLIGDNGVACLVLWHDWTVLVAAITIVCAPILVLALAVASAMGIQKDWTGGKADPWLGAGCTLLVASLLLHLGAATLNLVADWFFTYLNAYNPFWYAFHPNLDAYPALLRSLDYTHMPFHGRDALITMASPFVWIALLLMFLKFVKRTISPASAQVIKRQTESAERAHRAICETPASYFVVTSAVVLVLCALLWWKILDFGVDAHRAAALSPAEWREWWGNWPNRLAQHGLVVGTHLILVLFVAGWFSTNVRTTIAVLGDVVGYWPVTYHPSAALPYRVEVLRRAREQIEALDAERVLVIGHSQGSVLATDLIRSDLTRGGRRSTGLVTCGSPLKSLYSRFFPSVFDANRLKSIAAHTSLWVNFWRETDPISTNLGLASLTDAPTTLRRDAAPLADGLPGTDLKGHSDYWAEPDLRKTVDTWCVDGGLQPESS